MTAAPPVPPVVEENKLLEGRGCEITSFIHVQRKTSEGNIDLKNYFKICENDTCTCS